MTLEKAEPHGPNPKQKPLCADQSLPDASQRMNPAIVAVALVELVTDISPISVGKWQRMCVFSIEGFENANLFYQPTLELAICIR